MEHKSGQEMTPTDSELLRMCDELLAHSSGKRTRAVAEALRYILTHKKQPWPNHNWCIGCDPDNCPGCGTEPIERRKSAAAQSEEDPGHCVFCSEPFELVRPGKSQPTCNCWGG
jgi:hypothetical protein